MKKLEYLIYLLLTLCSFSCKKEHSYHVQGTLLNEVTGNGHNMGGEKIQLYRTGSGGLFGNRHNSTLEVTTDNEGHFDFGINKMKEGTYRLDFIQSANEIYYGVSNGAKEISLDKNTEINEQISIIPTMGAISFIANPLNTNSLNDTIFVEFISKTRLINNPTVLLGSHSTGNELFNDPYHSFGGINNTEFMGNIFIKITKSYNGVMIPRTQ